MVRGWENLLLYKRPVNTFMSTTPLLLDIWTFKATSKLSSYGSLNRKYNSLGSLSQEKTQIKTLSDRRAVPINGVWIKKGVKIGILW